MANNDTPEESSVRYIGERIGYGRTMQLCEKLWTEAQPGGAHSVGPCTSFLVPCPCTKRVGSEWRASCDWCCGSGRVTERVAEAMNQERDTPIIRFRFLDNNDAHFLISLLEDLDENGVATNFHVHRKESLRKVVSELRLRGTRDGDLF